MPCGVTISRDQFQSTLPQGERQYWRHSPGSGTGISIHAPARGATVSRDPQTPAHSDFNPRSRKGSDLFFVINCHRKINNFNPRSRKGSDLVNSISILSTSNFNPRSRKGSDVLITNSSGHTDPFQSTLPQGERLLVPFLICDISGFQSTLPQGERRHAHSF